MDAFPLLSTPAPTVRCHGIRANGRTCGLVLLREPWRSLGMGEDCAERAGLVFPGRPRFGSVASGAAEATLFDLINEGDAVDADVPAALDQLRRQVAALLSQIDTATLPSADRVRLRQDDYPGPEWLPLKGWRIFTIDNPDTQGVVYVDHDCGADNLAYRWDGPGNWEALRIEEARRIGLAFLAAAARADEMLAGVSRLADHRAARADKELA